MPVSRKPVDIQFFNFDDGALSSIASEFGITEVDSFCPILLDGEFCSLLEVRSETSRKMVIEVGDRKYFLKQIPWYCDDEVHVAFSHSVQTQLNGLGIPAPKLLSTVSGRSWAPYRGIKFCVFEFAPGNRYSGTEIEIRAMATCLAAIHTANISTPPLESEGVFALAKKHVSLLRDVVPETTIVGGIAEDWDARIDRLQQVALQNGAQELRMIAVHGDANPWNFLFDASRSVSAVLDFDNCGLDTRLHDIAEAILTSCALAYRGDSTNFSEGFSGSIALDKAAIFIEAYQSKSPLSATELACLPSILTSVAIELLALGLIRGDFRCSSRPLLERMLDSCEGFRPSH